MTAFSAQNWKEVFMTPNGIRAALKKLPEFQDKESALIAESIATIQNRRDLAHQIAAELFQSMPSSESHTAETLEAEVLQQLEQLQALLTLEQDEVVRKTERMAAIENDPEKKSLLTRATNMVKEGWETAKNNKYKILFALAAIAGGIAVWYYWDYLALLLGKVGFGAAGTAETGVAGGAEVAAEGVTQAEAVGAAVQKVLEESAKHATDFALVEHDIFYQGAKYSLESVQDVEKLTEILKGLGSDPKAIIRLLRSETARGLTESRFIELMSKHLPEEVFKNKLVPSMFIEEMANVPPTLAP